MLARMLTTHLFVYSLLSMLLRVSLGTFHSCRLQTRTRHRVRAFSMSKVPVMFVLSNTTTLRDYYSQVESIDDFVTRTSQLNPNLQRGHKNATLSLTALHRGFDDFFGERDPSELAMFVSSLVDYADIILNDYEKKGYRLFPIEPPLWRKSRLWCCGVLANAFLCNIAGDPVSSRKPSPDGVHSGIKFHRFFFQTSDCCVGKVKCLIQYFVTMQREIESKSSEVNAPVIFQRSIGPSMRQFRAMPAWNLALVGGSSPSSNGVVHDISVNAMENRDASAMVNFANKVFGVGEFWDSCTQEEIIQVCCPELNVGMLVYGEMPPDTVVIAHNVRRYSLYGGYGYSFHYQGPLSECCTHSLICMDASVTNDPAKQFSHAPVYRDIRKAYLGFLGSVLESSPSSGVAAELPRGSDRSTTLVSTGKWGCGAFGGDPVLKFLEQLIAAHLCGTTQGEDGVLKPAVALIFSAYRNQNLRTTLARVYAACDGLTPQSIVDDVLVRSELFDITSKKSHDYQYSAVIEALEHTPRVS